MIITSGKWIAWRQWIGKDDVLFVAQVKGEGGVDWGYTPDRAKAKWLLPHQAMSFRAHCRKVKAICGISPVEQ